MSSAALTGPPDVTAIEKVILAGDLKDLRPAERLAYYNRRGGTAAQCAGDRPGYQIARTDRRHVRGDRQRPHAEGPRR